MKRTEIHPTDAEIAEMQKDLVKRKILQYQYDQAIREAKAVRDALKTAVEQQQSAEASE